MEWLLVIGALALLVAARRRPAAAQPKEPAGGEGGEGGGAKVGPLVGLDVLKDTTKLAGELAKAEATAKGLVSAVQVGADFSRRGATLAALGNGGAIVRLGLDSAITAAMARKRKYKLAGDFRPSVCPGWLGQIISFGQSLQAAQASFALEMYDQDYPVNLYHWRSFPMPPFDPPWAAQGPTTPNQWSGSALLNTYYPSNWAVEDNDPVGFRYILASGKQEFYSDIFKGFMFNMHPAFNKLLNPDSRYYRTDWATSFTSFSPEALDRVVKNAPDRLLKLNDGTTLNPAKSWADKLRFAERHILSDYMPRVRWTLIAAENLRVAIALHNKASKEERRPSARWIEHLLVWGVGVTSEQRYNAQHIGGSIWGDRYRDCPYMVDTVWWGTPLKDPVSEGLYPVGCWPKWSCADYDKILEHLMQITPWAGKVSKSDGHGVRLMTELDPPEGNKWDSPFAFWPEALGPMSMQWWGSRELSEAIQARRASDEMPNAKLFQYLNAVMSVMSSVGSIASAGNAATAAFETAEAAVKFADDLGLVSGGAILPVLGVARMFSGNIDGEWYENPARKLRDIVNSAESIGAELVADRMDSWVYSLSEIEKGIGSSSDRAPWPYVADVWGAVTVPIDSSDARTLLESTF